MYDGLSVSYFVYTSVLYHYNFVYVEIYCLILVDFTVALFVFWFGLLCRYYIWFYCCFYDGLLYGFHRWLYCLLYGGFLCF